MEFAKETVLPNAYYIAGATYGAFEGLARGTYGLIKGESAKSKEANSKDYNAAYKKGEDYKATGQHKYESAKASADKHSSSFYHSAQDKTHSAKDTVSHKAHSAKDTVAHKTHEAHHHAKAQADDLEDDSLSKSEKAKEKVKDAMKHVKHSVKHAAHKVHSAGHKMTHPNEHH